MNPLWISMLFHAGIWLCAALFAIRLIGWNAKGCRRIFLAIGLDVLALAIGQLPEGSQALGGMIGNPLLRVAGLSPASSAVRTLSFGVSILLQLAALSLGIRGFFDSCRAAEELRFLQRSGTDRELIKQLDARPRATFDKPDSSGR